MLRLTLFATALLTHSVGCGTDPTGDNETGDDEAGDDDGQPTARIGLNDVSILLPAPASWDDERTLSFSTQGNGGPLLPGSMLASIAVFGDAPGGPNAPALYGDWRVVAARIDPCFPDLTLLASNPGACRRQLRLITQPIDRSSGTATQAAFGDAGIHLLYDLEAADFATMSARWLALRTDTSSDPALPLGIHPEISAQGLDGAVATELRDIITTYAGTATLRQLTFVQGRGTSWEFGGFMIEDGVMTPVEIHGLDTVDRRSQSLATTDTGMFDITPSTPVTVALGALRGTGAIGDVTLTASVDDIRSALQLTLDIDDPMTPFNADSVDCASCHIATRARHRAEFLGASMEGTEGFSSPDYALDLALPAIIQRAPDQQRAFGYNGLDAVWNQRVINESAVVAAYFATN